MSEMRDGFCAITKNRGALAKTAGMFFGIGKGRGIGLLITLAGLLLCVTAVILRRIQSIGELEKAGNYGT